ncbi:MAG: toll/interleukin-1 receptor domain-containing protein [Planctomycetaceae bacterium]|nr:toll/interleukin-1 receptor domain-containing protein [Planctomycetaceae bacterium]
MSWELRSFPECTHHAFIAYSSEDEHLLARPLRDELQDQRGVATWLAAFDFPADSTSIFETLRHHILRSRLIVYLITPNSMSHGRGWQAVERAYGELLSRSMRMATHVQTTEFALIFGCEFDPNLERSCWRDLIEHDRARVFPRELDLDVVTQIRWAADQVEVLLHRQAISAKEFEQLVQRDPDVAGFLVDRPGLKERIACESP